MRATTKRLGPAAIGLAIATAALAQGDYEAPPGFKASEVLPPALVKGPHFEVAPAVRTEGFFHEFTLKSDYGDFDVEGISMLVVRLREVDALGKLADVSKSEVFLKAAGTSVVNVGKGVASAVSDPGATAKGVGGGLKRFGQNLGRQAKRAGEDVSDAAKKDDKKAATEPEKSAGDKAASTGETAANSALGVNSAMRRWAQKVGADPYTTNTVLRKALEDIGKVDAAGGIAAKVAVPIPQFVSATSSVGNLVWGKDPQALLKMNEQRLAELGVDKRAEKALSRSKVFTLTYQTLFIDALYAVKAKGSASYVDTASDAATEREAVFFTESAQMLRKLNAANGFTAILPETRALVAKARDGRALALVPVDYLGWTQSLQKAATEIAERAKKELGATGLELQASGRVSDLAKRRMQGLGWTVKEGVAVADVAAAGKASAKPAARR
jgi:hypothetical protein